MTANDELIRLSACKMVDLLKTGQVTALEAVDASLARIEQVNPSINAMVALCADRARRQAKEMTSRKPAAEDGGFRWLAGLPFAVKDLNDLAGVRTTYGSPIFADNLPERSDIMVEHLERRGGIPVGMSNSPEFGAGGNTFNEVYGETFNPWNTTLNAGGSSGGAAAALAAGEVWLATGSDLGGSLRTPASFCSVVGLRPTPGRVASGPNQVIYNALPVDGPMARNVADVGLMLDAMVGWSPEDPISLEAPATSFRAAAEAPRTPKRIAYSANLGITPIDPRTREVCDRAVRRFEDLGCVVEEACPDFAGVAEAFQTLRALGFATSMRGHYEDNRHHLKPDVIWNIERGLALTPQEIGDALLRRGRLYAEMLAFFKTYDLLVCPAACTPPLDIKQRWVRELEGVTFDNYVEWLRIASVITMTSHPSLAVPAGFTGDGRPVGLQLVGRPRGEAELLAAGAAFEQLVDIARLTPIDPRGK